MAVTDWSTTAASNTTVGAVPLGENAMAPSDVNNAIREIMAQVAQGIDDGDFSDVTGLQTLDATLTALAAVTFAANKGLYSTAADAFSTYDLSAFGRTLGGLASYSALRTALGAVTVTASSLASPGYITFDISGTPLTIQWGTGTISANSTGTISFPVAFATWAVCVPVGGRSDGNTSSEGDVHPYSITGLTSQAIAYSGTSTARYNWIAVGS